jgi:hypothetical protein
MSDYLEALANNDTDDLAEVLRDLDVDTGEEA